VKKQTFDVAIVGGGIAGLSFAYTAAEKGHRVIIFEKDSLTSGASIRNFGLIWPIGQPAGPRFDLAMKSRELWMQLSRKAGFWISQNGSLFVASAEDEMQVLKEYHDQYGFNTKILSPSEVSDISGHIHTEKIRGALFSPFEMTVNPSEAILSITNYLKNLKNVTTKTGEMVLDAGNGMIRTSSGSWKADRIIICSGSVTHALYSDVLKQSGMAACKLQMMKFKSLENTFTIGPTICGGLTLQHYESFKGCPSIDQLRKRILKDLPEYVKHGVHVIVAQNNHRELIIGDSHEYGDATDPFNNTDINNLILTYLEKYFPIKNLALTKSWHGVYLKNPGRTEFVYQADPSTFLITGFGGGGMTLAPAFAEQFLSSL
jgi:D-hydroxyproline dehydrogenase subunit beta